MSQAIRQSSRPAAADDESRLFAQSARCTISGGPKTAGLAKEFARQSAPGDRGDRGLRRPDSCSGFCRQARRRSRRAPGGKAEVAMTRKTTNEASRAALDAKLDEALEESFPASDPPQASEPAPGKRAIDQARQRRPPVKSGRAK
jgi:hypothetical protein